MELDRNQKIFLAVGAFLAVGIAAVGLNNIETDGQPESSNSSDWRNVELEDVSTGEKYTISELEKPVLLETFAVWCPTCTQQQKEVKKIHDEEDVTSVSLDTDPNEDAQKIKNHINRHGFDWRYSVAPPEMTQSLRKEFGVSFLNPPLAPMAIVCEDGVRRLNDGVKKASKLSDEIEKGC